jgi:4-hydroxy-4-methyl-2-oxoglutarate aldolase
MQTMTETDLLARLERTSFPTFGHFLEDGFADHALRAMVPGKKIVGRALTLRLASPNAFAVSRAVAQLGAGDVLVIDARGDHAHAPIGAVTGTAIVCSGAMGIVIDGVVTDIVELRAMGLPVFARGTSLLTTKRVDAPGSAVGEPVRCGGVMVNPGDLVLADDNGVMFLAPSVAAAWVDRALASDAGEPAILARLQAGEPARTVFGLAE